MAKTRSMTKNQNHDSASGRKRIMTCDKGDVPPWSDLDHNLLFLIMMQLGFVDFFSFGEVCKSWRSLALSNKKEFMKSRLPMPICISSCGRKKGCYVQDLEGRRFKTILPHSAGRICVGLSCGYLILFGRKTCDFWLVNPVTRHELHFPAFPSNVATNPARMKVMLVFSPSLSKWVFVLLQRFTVQIWFSVAGTQAWNLVSSTFGILDLHAFKGKIYTIHMGCSLCELIFYPEPKLTSLKTKNNIMNPELFYRPEFVSSGENLYLMNHKREDRYTFQELDVGEMKWVSSEKTIKEYALFISDLNHGSAIKLEQCAKYLSPYWRDAYFLDTNRSAKYRLYTTNMWYFPHDSLNDYLVHE